MTTSNEVSIDERWFCVSELLTQFEKCHASIMVLMREAQPIDRATYIAQLRVIHQELNRAHSKALNFYNAEALAASREGVKRG